MIICICGKSGSGKSHVAKLLTYLNENIISLNIDEVGHNSLKNENVKSELIKSFGNTILINDEISRKKLGEIVFNNRENMKKLEEITWKVMEEEIDNYLENNKNKIIVLDYFYLPYTKYFKASKLKLFVAAPYETRLFRAMERDNITKEQFILRESSGIDYDVNSFDYVINNIDLKETERLVERFMTKVLYPGSFDPLTKGHMNIIEQTCCLFDEIIIAIMKNPLKKNFFFTEEERLNLIKEIYKNNKKIKVICSDQTAVDLAIENNCKTIIRGLRSLTDFDFEIQLSQINKHISNNRVNTICLFADSEYQFISSTMVKEVFRFDKDISYYVDQVINEAMLIKKRGNYNA